MSMISDTYPQASNPEEQTHGGDRRTDPNGLTAPEMGMGARATSRVVDGFEVPLLPDGKVANPNLPSADAGALVPGVNGGPGYWDF